MGDPMEMRRYQLQDIPSMVECLKFFLAEAGNYKGFPLNVEKVTKLLKTNVNNAYFFCNVLVVDGSVHAGLAAMTTLLAFSDTTIASDMILFVRKDSRKLGTAVKLIEDYIEWGKARKVKRLLLGATTGIDVEGFDLLMSHVGFRELGRVWAKDME